MVSPPDNQEDQRKRAIELFKKAYDQQMKGKLEAAIEQYQTSISIYPTAEAYTFLGWTLSFMGRYDEAIKECHKAIETDPDFGNPYNDIGAYLIKMDQHEEAIPWLEKAIKAPRYESYCYPHLNLGRIWEKKGLWDRAIKSYQQALDFNPDYVLATRALNRLRGMMN